MTRAFGRFVARQIAIILVGAAAVMGISRPLNHLPVVGLICIATVAAVSANTLAQRYTYLFSDRGIFLTTLARNPRLFRRTLALWERDGVAGFRFWDEAGDGWVRIDLVSGGRRRSLLISLPQEDAHRLAAELTPLLESRRVAGQAERPDA
jgi:hypothetical protein